VGEHVDPGLVADRVLERARGRLPVDAAVDAQLGRHVREQVGEPLGAGVVVAVGLVPLEHRELGVVLVRDALVAEVLAELVHALEPADDQPLQVQLGGDA
jgi:hypothetical protein